MASLEMNVSVDHCTLMSITVHFYRLAVSEAQQRHDVSQHCCKMATGCWDAAEMWWCELCGSEVETIMYEGSRYCSVVTLDGLNTCKIGLVCDPQCALLKGSER